MPVYRLTASSIISSFRVSGKRHLLLTGGRGTGKTTLLRALVPLLCPGAQEITTAAYPADRVEIRESVGGKIAVIGRFDPALPPGENRMRPVADGFLLLGVPALHRMAAGESEWAVLDELGYLENSCPEFRQAVEALLDAKRVLAIVRKQDTPFLTALCARQDAFVVDLDDPAPALGCVVMASGLGRRFDGNKLMADFCGAPLIANALALAALPLLACRIVVTRSEEVEALCNAQGVPVLRHARPYRSDTVRLGLAALLGKEPALRGCLFLPGDQPLLTQQSVEALALAAAPDAIVRLCAADGTPGSPVLFGADYFSELLHLPEGRGGNAVARAHPGFRLPCVRPERCRTEGCGYAGGPEPAASADKQIKIPCSSKKLHGIFYFITYYMIVNWQARMASSAVWWLWGVTPAQQSDKTSISVSGKAARSTMALLITQISVQ